MGNSSKYLFYSTVIFVAAFLFYHFYLESKAIDKEEQVVMKSAADQSEYVNVDSFGANGEDTKDDSKSIQAAINYSQKSKIGKVRLLGNNNYVLKKGLVLKEGVELEFGQNTKVRIEGNFKAIKVMKNASITNGIFEIVDAKFDSDVIYLDGKEKFWSWERTQIQNVSLLNISGSHKGTGLHLYAGGSDQFICFVNFSDMKIAGFHTGVKLESKEPKDKKYSFINGNRFINFTLDDCVRGVFINSSISVPNESSGNEFSGLQIQLSKYTKRAILVSGSDNKFEGLIWDVHILRDNRSVIEFSKDSMRSSLESNLSSKYIVDKGEQNYYTSPEEK
ncbi:glycosyl hydrolase family 28-related protein [Neobacillus cucumis]|uniref:glycosyl hydrolase family 28-related protein n=1 Tax=Neobacillus cucumis TaxID=1740721 RepID=UPI0028531684|nr:glycosyl hydrolase family 28-related protein [Neobacillus cucumis]MDR4949083.1 glycosyl hydrolase family 28-related protein [Neobacillus cucumis]